MLFESSDQNDSLVKPAEVIVETQKQTTEPITNPYCVSPYEGPKKERAKPRGNQSDPDTDLSDSEEERASEYKDKKQRYKEVRQLRTKYNSFHQMNQIKLIDEPANFTKPGTPKFRQLRPLPQKNPKPIIDENYRSDYNSTSKPANSGVRSPIKILDCAVKQSRRNNSLQIPVYSSINEVQEHTRPTFDNRYEDVGDDFVDSSDESNSKQTVNESALHHVKYQLLETSKTPMPVRSLVSVKSEEGDELTLKLRSEMKRVLLSPQFYECTSVDQMVDRLVDRIARLAGDESTLEEVKEQPETDLVDSDE